MLHMVTYYMNFYRQFQISALMNTVAHSRIDSGFRWKSSTQFARHGQQIGQ
jgi:hypothetical protein